MAEATSYYYEIVNERPGGQTSAASTPTNVTPILLPRQSYRDGTVAYANRTWPGRTTARARKYIVQRALANGGAFATIRHLQVRQPLFRHRTHRRGQLFLSRGKRLTGSAGSSFSAVITMTNGPLPPSAVSATAMGNQSPSPGPTIPPGHQLRRRTQREQRRGMGNIGTAMPGGSPPSLTPTPCRTGRNIHLSRAR